MRVKVANGVTLPIEFIGSIVLRISAGDVRHGNGDYSTKETLLEVRDALYVPGLCATLLSIKAMFQKQGIRTYLNDELRLVLLNDNHVRIRESCSTNCTAALASDTFVYAVTGKNDTVELLRGQVGQFDGRFEKILSTLASAISPLIASISPSNTCAVSKSSCDISIQTVVLA
eukprot:6174418-Pleurochrysis_carterae.AAC.1